MAFLEVSAISKEEREFSLRAIGFSQPSLWKIAIAGETGSGKSTLLKIIAGLVQPDSGEVRFKGQRVAGPLEKLIPGHPGIAYVSQEFELPHHYTVENVLDYENRLTEKAAATLFAVGRISHLLGRKTHELSGGERQRIAMVRALIAGPQLLLLDEPFSNLDNIHKDLLKSMIIDIGERLGISCILVSHDPQDTLSWADEIFVMKAGAIVQRSAPRELYARPADEYVAGLFGRYNLLPPDSGLFPELERKGKRLFVRPEKVLITEERIGSLPALVKRVSFWGSYYELELVWGETSILVRTGEARFVKGDVVYIHVEADGVWYI